MTAASPPLLATATAPVVRALLDEARRKNYRHGVLGVRARPQWSGPAQFSHEGVEVTVVACESALAAREALLGRRPDQWLVVLTDRDESDLGAGVLAHLAWHRLRTPDPWDAVRGRFAASGIDPALVTTAHHRDIAVGLLAATPPGGWPPAPGGVLTRGHAMAAVARAHLGFDRAAGPLAWSVQTDVANRVADLRALAGDQLTDAVLAWAAEGAAAAAHAVLGLLRSGQARETVPLGLVVGVLGEATRSDASRAQTAREGLVRLEPLTGGVLPEAASVAWASEAASVVTTLLATRAPDQRAAAYRVLARADELLAGAHAAALADGSDVLPSGLTRRLAALAGALRTVPAAPAGGTDPDRPLVTAAVLAVVERAWAQASSHELADSDPRVPSFRAAVRLARWLALDTTGQPGMRGCLERQRDDDGWVDSAVNDAAAGVADAELGAGLGAVLAAVAVRRRAHDRSFAAALADYTGTGSAGAVWHLERLLPEVVLPLARQWPVLLLVLDGMSVAVANEVVGGVLDWPLDGWGEALLPGQPRRAAALAVLPTLTDVSRTSLLCGDLRTGQQDVEHRGYAEVTTAFGVPGAALFHKRPLETIRRGFAVADDVAAAINDGRRRLVTCVLNTIDDALDRSDPGGTDWAGDAVKHLRPLLEVARNADRIVVLTSDHGHIVERRQGVQRPHPGISSGRSRPADPPPGDGEVLVEGERVLLHGGRAVLAVDEELRYGPLKAGYHGGAAPAEAVVPVITLVAGGVVPDEVDLRLAPPQQPAWWDGPAPAPTKAPQQPVLPPVAASGPPTLFDQVDSEPPAGQARERLAAALVSSPTFAEQRGIAGRVSVSDQQLEGLVAALVAAPDHRLAPTAAATALGVPALGLRGAVLHAQRLLNVESYPVLRLDSDGATVVLDVPLLCEQFGLAP
ncbi:MAG TPA: BREX-2 system phosphatase PglZ [Pseudonocardiaceae bacterium]|nr:BREX-2 system phosphatase PglZ [Pseudonocardiaceae bacterium]